MRASIDATARPGDGSSTDHRVASEAATPLIEAAAEIARSELNRVLNFQQLFACRSWFSEGGAYFPRAGQAPGNGPSEFGTRVETCREGRFPVFLKRGKPGPSMSLISCCG